MKYKNILLTGASGELGRTISGSKIFSHLLTPSRETLDITKSNSIKKFFGNNDFDAVIHCAALARMGECEENPIKAIETNIIGTCNLASEIMNKEKNENKNSGSFQKKLLGSGRHQSLQGSPRRTLPKQTIRLVHMSTDGVYPGTKGNYSENDAAKPYNTYGWTKLGAECAVNALSNFCIIRTSFFDPGNIKFKDAAIDAYSSKVPISYLVKAINTMLNCDFTGTINIGRERKSDYEHYKEFKPSIKKCKLADIQKTVNFKMYRDSSMNISLWEKIEKSKSKNK